MVATTSTTQKPHRTLTKIDRSTLALHGLAAAVIGVIAFVGANDPGWGGLQRLVIVMLIGLWVAGIIAMGFVVRYVENQWARTAVLLGGPFIGVVFLLGASRLG